jgi:hypothetical protein
VSEVEIRTVDTILDKGVRVPVPAPFFLRWVGIRSINVVVRRPTCGNMLRISKRYLKLNIATESDDWRDWMTIYSRAAKPAARIVALGMIRGRTTGYLFARPLGWWLFWHTDSKQLAEIAALLVSLSGVQDFMNTITFLRAMKTTEPRNVSP